MTMSRLKKTTARALCGPVLGALGLLALPAAAVAGPCERGASAAASSAAPAGAASRFLEKYEETWMEHFHRDIDEEFPGGRSNYFHDKYTKEAVLNLKTPMTTGWKISNQHYICDGDWYAVQWFYEATLPTTGQLERESTLAFGKVKDGQLIVWKEYYDDSVGRYQWMGAMPLYATGEMPYPWPAGSVLRRAYRP